MAVLVCSLAMVGCSGDDDEATGGTGGSGGASGNGGTSGAGATVSFYGLVSWTSPPNPPSTTAWTDDGYAEGLEFCLRGTQNCVQVDANGHYKLSGVPTSSRVALIATHPESDRNVLLFETETSPRLYSPRFGKTAKSSTWLAAAGCASPPKAGTGILFVGAPPGSTVKLTPPATVVYTKEDGTFDPALSSIPAAMSADLTGSIACDLAPGKYQIDIGQTTESCHTIEGWTSTGHDVEAEVEADSVTGVNWVCE